MQLRVLRWKSVWGISGTAGVYSAYRVLRTGKAEDPVLQLRPSTTDGETTTRSLSGSHRRPGHTQTQTQGLLHWPIRTSCSIVNSDYIYIYIYRYRYIDVHIYTHTHRDQPHNEGAPVLMSQLATGPDSALREKTPQPNSQTEPCRAGKKKKEQSCPCTTASVTCQAGHKEKQQSYPCTTASVTCPPWASNRVTSCSLMATSLRSASASAPAAGTLTLTAVQQLV